MRGFAAAALLWTLGCTHEISSEERLDRESNSVPVKQAIAAADLQKISCADTAQELVKARNENRPEAERVTSYMQLYESLKKKTATFEEAMTRNPDLHYQEGSQEFVNAHDLCVQQQADVKVEFNVLVRDLVEVPTVQEIKGGATVVVARLDFGTLRLAIESLNPDDKDSLMSRVNNAEKKVESTTPTTATPTAGKRGRR